MSKLWGGMNLNVKSLKFWAVGLKCMVARREALLATSPRCGFGKLQILMLNPYYDFHAFSLKNCKNCIIAYGQRNAWD